VFTPRLSSRAHAIHPALPLATRSTTWIATVQEVIATIAANQRHGLRHPGPRTDQSFAYIRVIAREKLVALISTISRLSTPKVAACSESSGKAPARADWVLSGSASASATRPPSRPESSWGSTEKTAINTGKMLVNACAARVIARSNGSSRFIWLTTVRANRTREGGDRR
jgi:hypothetical protein